MRVITPEDEKVQETARRGPGAPRQFDEETVRTSAYLPASVRDGVAAIGGGNFSAGVRHLYESYVSGQAV